MYLIEVRLKMKSVRVGILLMTAGYGHPFFGS
ncbi:MAG: hypothetical protein ACJAYN_002253 [Bermanella sp.]|jgi:hypothetical protein